MFHDKTCRHDLLLTDRLYVMTETQILRISWRHEFHSSSKVLLFLVFYISRVLKVLRYSTTAIIPASIQLFRWSLKRIRPVMCTIALGLVTPSCFFSTCKTLLLVKTAILCEFNQQLPTNPFIYFW